MGALWDASWVMQRFGSVAEVAGLAGDFVSYLYLCPPTYFQRISGRILF